jgi:glycosyltransferase involved in cell wall biosynthesis
MKIAIIGSRGYPYAYSAYETLVRELGERLVKQGVEVTVYCHRNLFKGRPHKLNGIDLVYLPTIERKTLSQFLHSFQAILHACLRGYDVIFVVNVANGPFGIFTKIFHKKTAINVDGLEWLRPKWKGLGSKYFYWAAKAATKLYDVIITDSFEMQKVYKEGFNAASTVIAYGATIRYSKNPNVIKKWNLEKDNYYLIVGRLIPDNNTHIIIREFLKSNSRKKIVFAGGALYNDYYARQIKSIDDKRVIFTGWIIDPDILAELYHQCFAYLHGHEFGGTNPVLLEALAYGCAVIALDTEFSREVLKDGEYGLFFNKNNDNLKELIDKVEREPSILINYREKSRERIKENYTWDKVTHQYLEIFRKLSAPKCKR